MSTATDAGNWKKRKRNNLAEGVQEQSPLIAWGAFLSFRQWNYKHLLVIRRPNLDVCADCSKVANIIKFQKRKSPSIEDKKKVEKQAASEVKEAASEAA